MKQKSVLFIIFIVLAANIKAQWDSLPVKTKLIYSFARGHVITNYGGTKEDKSKIYFKKSVAVTIDTILYLVGQNRKLFVLSKCLNDIVLNENFKIYNGNIKRPDDYEKIYNITGQLIVNDSGTSDASKQITAIYKYKRAIYFLTLPKDFYYSLNSTVIGQLDKALLKSISDSTEYGIYETDVFVTANKNNFPLKKIILLNNNSDQYSDETFQFHIESNSQRLPFEQDVKNLSLNNKYMNEADKYVYRTNKGEPLKTLYLSPKYGIVHSYSYANNFNKEHPIEYINILDLIGVEMPKY
jgi:hypothetical protein